MVLPIILLLLLVVNPSQEAVEPILLDNGLCPVARCVTYDEVNTLWAVPDAAYFQQCRRVATGGWALQLMPCAPGTLFSYKQQVCVLPVYWKGCAALPDEQRCAAPRCGTYKEVNTLWVHESSDKFYQCRRINGTWAPLALPCAPGTLYSFKHQVCVLPSMWEASCNDE
ncbi:uncharacterized protein LOC120906255 [Anopheles arabiensis]|uniref:AGAP001024-PA n=3 Tax=gambiae species complex TaxID=44542 RepID=Q5TW87_ANOGA|nr:uncharacterized protein LOC120906255 [Anopheles arabiensis]XP_040173728.1 uncharacterized protein LOC120906255 [Anopheles arabiensis]XP_040173729.1 uncharacterized protein LOC120906255 [Anopheles arabiensis]EAL41689.2 AGAP001024-PA [Anopheles gambiae str. PEST]